MYHLVRPLLFALPPELAHHVSMGALEALCAVSPGSSRERFPGDPVRLWNLEFPNPVGLAAGLDKSGDHFESLGRFGFGFIEIGTVTPRAQPGNPKPRLFRLVEHGALINRMGFNNRGVDHLVERVRRRRYRGVLGINIGKNASTPVERAADDYLTCLERVYEYADYVTVNISSPNTEGLRSLQYGDGLRNLLHTLKARQGALAERTGRAVPLLVKLAPDLTDEEIVAIAGIIRDAGIEGVVATNTTVTRDAVAGHRFAGERGGLSGRPVDTMATRAVAALHAELGSSTPIIGVGGIDDGESARAKLAAGASLVQIYTSFIYRGPGVVREIARALAHTGGSDA